MADPTPEPHAEPPATGAFVEEAQDGQPQVADPAQPQPQPQAAALEAEADDWDHDSALNASLASSTTSLSESILKFREENGRTYHAYKDGVYAFPNDERENDRLDFQHHIYNLTYSGRLYTAPIPKTQTLHRVLDVGTGTGIWAIDFADEHPESHVIGIDLSPIQPQSVPPNLTFEVDDLEEPWTFPNKFDFVFARMMVGSFADFPKFFEQAFASLSPGGWIEMSDICFPVACDDGSLPKESALEKWSSLILEGGAAVGRFADCPTKYKEQLAAAGFTNIQQTVYKWPQNRWPKDPKFKELGMWVLEDLAPGLEALSAAIFTRILGWSKEELDVFLVDVRKDMKNTKYHSYWNIYTVTAQKPL